ncbi:hypothetical protein BGZ51_009378 [Haplosporangium sp. Z 767]|nr:hypothetical protein BGZ51_009378 [Haplosporangium sp. Z 767]
MNPNSGQANGFASAFGNQTSFFGMGNNSANTNSSNNHSAFAFNNNNNNPNPNHNFNATNVFNSSPNVASAFGNNNSLASGAFHGNNASGGQGQFSTFDTPSNNNMNSVNSRGRGRGRGNNTAYRGGRGGANRGGPNMTYVAPGLSTSTYQQNQQQKQQQYQNQQQFGQQVGSAFMNDPSSSSVNDAGSAFPGPGANRGRGGGHARGRGRGGAGGGVPGQFRSLQWRPDQGAQSTNSDMSMQDARTGINNNGDFGQMQSAFNSSGPVTLGAPAGISQHGMSFSAFGNQNQGAISFNQQPQQGQQVQSAFGMQNQNAGISQHGGSAYSGVAQSGHNQWNSSSGFSIGAPVSNSGGASVNVFNNSTSAGSIQPSSAFASNNISNSSPLPNNKQQDSVSVFAVPSNSLPSQSFPTVRSTTLSTPKNDRSTGSGSGSAFASKAKSLLTDTNSSRLGPADATSRLARFSAVPIGNQFEELKEKRVKERADAIKRGDIPDPDKPQRLEDAIAFIGTCPDMCPEYERHQREYQQNVEKFEKIPGTESIDHSRAVKSYPRSAAGADQPLPSDVRPPAVLLSTLDYLITEIVSQGDLEDSHGFVRDRTRSIRQDFTLQNSRGVEAVQAHEIIARYHILCLHEMCENKGFSEQQEMEQLRKVLMSLQEFYDDLRTEGISCPNEAEFRAYNILCHLREADVIRQAQLLPQAVFQDPYIQVAVEIHALTRRNNNVRQRAVIQSEASPNFFSRFFKMVAGPATTYLMACLLETNFVEIRKGALKALNKSYLDQHEGFPIKDLINILGFDGTEECLSTCEEYGLELTNQGQPAVVFGRKDPATRRRIFKEGTIPMQHRRNQRLVEVKRQNYTTAQIIYGETPGPHQGPTAVNKWGSISNTPSTNRMATIKGSQGRTAGSTVSPFGIPAAAPTVSAALPKPPAAGVTAAASAFPSSTSMPGLPTSSPFHSALSSAPNFSNTPSSTTFSLPSSSGGLSVGTAAPNNQLSASSSLNPAAQVFKPASSTDFSFNASQAGTAAIGIVTAGATARAASSSASAPSQPPAFSFKGPEQTKTAPFTFTPPGQSTSSGPTTAPSSFSFSASTGLNVPSKSPAALSTSSISQPNASPFTTPPPVTPVAPPKSDATRIVTKRGRIVPRSLVDAFINEFMAAESSRMIRATAAQMVQEVKVERSVRRARERAELVQRESLQVMSELTNHVIASFMAEIQSELEREELLQRWVITRWKEYTRQCLQRAQELRRRTEHFISNVRAMGSRAGLDDGNPMALRIRDYKAHQHQQRIHGAHIAKRTNEGAAPRDLEGIKSMVEAVTEKRRRLLSIGQEGSPDLALVTGLKKVVEPKRELWAPLPVLKIIESHYHQSTNQSQQRQQDIQETITKGRALVKRRWRLFVHAPNFKDKSTKWLLTKLGIDMGRQNKVEQQSGTMVAVHQGSVADENAMDVVVHGSEDQSVMKLLGLSKHTIMETAAFIFEFSRIPFGDFEATDEAIRQYWTAERDRLVQFLACFPKVKQPLVCIMWTDTPEVWERISPHMVEYLELDKMVAAPKGPLRGYRFLNLNMKTMKLDPYIIGTLEWLATETRDFIEEPSVLLKGLLDKYRPIFDWSLSLMSLAEAPLYSQFDEDDEEEANAWLSKVRQRKYRMTNGETVRAGTQLPLQQPRNLFVEATESGFNLAVKLFNLELESLAQTIAAKGVGETREGAEEEGKVKDAIARFIRQAELPEMKRGAVQDRINFGMDARSAFCDFVDVYIATLSGPAKELQNLESKAAMRKEIWEMMTSSKEDRVPIEPIFKRICNQVLTWIQAGIIDADRFKVRLQKWGIQRHELLQKQSQYRRQHQYEDMDEVTFAPVLIHDEVDVEGNVFDYERTAEVEVQEWERVVQQQVRDREERATAVDSERRSSVLYTPSISRLGNSRKRRAPESSRNTLKKSRIQQSPDAVTPSDADDNLFLAPVSPVTNGTCPSHHPHTSSAAAPANTTTNLSSPSLTPSLHTLSTLSSVTPKSVSIVSSPTPVDRLARLRGLIKDVKATTLHQQQQQQQHQKH